MRYAFIFASLLAVGSTTLARQSPSSDSSERLNLGLRGVYFVPNQGQWSDAQVHYGLRSRGLDVAFRDSSLTMHMVREATEASPKRERGMLALDNPNPLPDGSPGEPADFEYLTLTLTFPGSNDVQPQGADPQSARFNYFVGGEGRSSASNVPSFGAVIYENLYDGIDLHVMGNDSGILKYEFHVAPGADWSQIAIAYDGIDSLCIDETGDLQINTTFGTLTDAAPLAWQGDADSGAIPARFELVDDQIYRIALDGPVDPTRKLIIDPDVEWMYYYGGSGTEWGYAIVLDASDNMFMSGSTSSTDFEGGVNGNHGGTDAFVAKLDPSGALLWMTYLGGSGTDKPSGYSSLALDDGGGVHFTGTTSSTDFEGRNNANHGGDDAFVVRLNSSGALLGMTYLGGSGPEQGTAIALDSVGDAIVIGRTGSTDFEGRTNGYHGFFDAFAAKVGSAGTVQWMLYLGGTGDYHTGDNAYAIAIDEQDSVWVSGTTDSDDFEGRLNERMSFIANPYLLSVNAAGQLEWMYYIQIESAQIHSMVLEDAGTALLAGQSQEGGCCGYVMKVDSQGVILWRTAWNHDGDENWSFVLAVDGDGNIYVAGYTDAIDLEGRDNVYHGGYSDAVASKLSPSGEIMWSTYLGGTNRDEAQGVALDSAGNLLVAGSTQSTDFEGGINTSHGGRDAFIVRINLAEGPQLTVNATCPSGGPIQVSWTGATPDGQVALLFARNTGSVTIPNGRPCAGTILGLGANQIQIAFQGSAGSNGSRTLNATAGPAACGGYLQLLDAATCSTSNVALIE